VNDWGGAFGAAPIPSSVGMALLQMPLRKLAGLGQCAGMCLDARPAIDLDRPDDESDNPHGHDDAGSLSQGRAGWPEWATRYLAVDNPPNRDSYRRDRGEDHQAHWVEA
jgi:hypothetical protein